ncbi:uncharacterized protein N7529_000527 [Penicillium soppii]|uniref:uncharacterized protein n=1 Tax=Penicillium soppii TaxID=69789 RepID=UPI00254680C8|nr:uncharacterized protein N7529_000527 [Penicillium soppii]KAJ5881855.1 hypothetical protein N7529_000527 [Penicillium soppii]
MGNGAKTLTQRKRDTKTTKAAGSQRDSNEKAMNIQCKICKQTFLQTTKAPALMEHAANKHAKLPAASCFDALSGTA